jgi:UDP-N-acetylglucosamine 2-epimerase (non-hydrolysing)
VPVLVTRESTERPEGIEAGTSTLVGMNRDKIVQNVLLKLKNLKKEVIINPFGDGLASKRILNFLEENFGEK